MYLIVIFPTGLYLLPPLLVPPVRLQLLLPALGGQEGVLTVRLQEALSHHDDTVPAAIASCLVTMG